MDNADDSNSYNSVDLDDQSAKEQDTMVVDYLEVGVEHVQVKTSIANLEDVGCSLFENCQHDQDDLVQHSRGHGSSIEEPHVGYFKPRGGGEAGSKGTPQKEMQYTRTGCKAQMRVKMIEDGRWTITTFHKEHNHTLIVSPSKSRFFRSHRFITHDQKEMISLLSEQNISTTQIMSFMAAREGGAHNIHFIRKDLSNQVSESNRRLIGVDVSTTINYFRELQARDSLFFYALEVDEQSMARNLFWIDGRSRIAYQNFGDVVTFDTTYMTNKYSRPFAPFIGVNHHRQSIFFGCALIRDETANTFCWLFQTWLEAMFGQHPKAIITDQDPAMRKAIQQVFPNTVHRCCLWHVMRKAKEHFSLLYSTREGFKDDLLSCINNSITAEEFEIEWSTMVEKYGLQDNNHIQVMWNNRYQWAPAYFRDTFFSNMGITQRSESINAVSKIWVDCHTSIYKFVTQFHKMLESRYDKEDEADFRTCGGEASLWSYSPIEIQARDAYTKANFLEFKTQLRLSTRYESSELEKYSLYKVSTIVDPILPSRYVQSYEVSVDVASKMIVCTCKLFKFAGLLCSHVLRVMLDIKMHLIPLHYILKRWTKDAKKGSSSIQLVKRVAMGDDPHAKALRVQALTQKAQKIIFEGAQSFGSFELACEKADKLVDEIISYNQASKGSQDDEVEAHLPIPQIDGLDLMVKDPPSSQCKGKRKPQRFKPPAEK
ncbi:protein FAR1-RELATED SEQUENCE 5-like isoform X2 [Ananas comosus]|uniref:Protein FAR1-RELATED SEQUENCE n=1 Tax=Ananas comosus TaxID=4615 RepID=A0A6P5FQA5_ANACO|nr:protein FAR1-RELATED SEQUENCE 5-like isoform X2 [Ananas comosus]